MNFTTKTIVALLVLVLLATDRTCLSLQAETDIAKAFDEVSKPFEESLPKNPLGKIVLIEVDRSTTLESKSTSAVLKDATVSKVGDRFFVTGTAYSPKEVAHWASGMTVGIAWDSVTRFYSMTPEQFERYAERWKERYEDRE